MIITSEEAFFILIVVLVLRIVRQEIRFWIRCIAYLLLQLSAFLNKFGSLLVKLIQFADDFDKLKLQSRRNGSRKS